MHDEQLNAAAKLTIITVCYQSAPQLELTISNVAGIKREGISYLVIDGGSTDGTTELLRKNGSVVDRWVSEPDRGIYDAMNKGWAAASSDSYILFLGAGDRIISLPPDLGTFRPDDVLYGDVRLEGRVFRGAAGFGLRCNNTLHHQALLVHKSLHPDPPFDTRFKVYADFDFNQRLMKSGARFVHSPAFSSSALPGGVSSRKAHLETLRIVRKNFGLLWCGIASVYLLLQKVARTLGAVR